MCCFTGSALSCVQSVLLISLFLDHFRTAAFCPSSKKPATARLKVNFSRSHPERRKRASVDLVYKFEVNQCTKAKWEHIGTQYNTASNTCCIMTKPNRWRQCSSRVTAKHSCSQLLVPGVAVQQSAYAMHHPEWYFDVELKSHVCSP